MKKTLLITSLLFSTFLYSQKVEKLEITKNGVNGFLVREYQNKESKEIYKSIKDWTEYNIKNAKYATNSNVENEFISFKINSIGTIHFKKKPTWNLDLYVEVRVRENKARIDIEILEIDGIREGQNSLNISGSGIIMGLYKRNGKFVKPYKETREEINNILNNFSNKIFESVLGNKDYKKDDW
jgi:hypothetical protein